VGKKLINKNHLQDAYCREQMTFVVDKGMILSQSAMDFAREYQIKLIYSTNPVVSAPPAENMQKKIKNLLKCEYGIENEQILKAILDKINQK
jgi:hypothetical protein